MTTLNGLDISSLLGEIGVRTPRGTFADMNYNLPAKEWFFSDFTRSLDSLLRFFSAKNWVAEANDCDDFARLAAALAQILHHRTNQLQNTALAIGEFHYKDAKIGPHAINFAVVNDGGYKIVFMEPQHGHQLFLNEEEIKSCFYWRI